MTAKILVKKDTYYDSVTLMALSRAVTGIDGVTHAVVVMGTDHNKELLAGVGLLDETARAAGPNDLVIAIAARDANILSAALVKAEEMLAKRHAPAQGAAGAPAKTVASGVRALPGANLALISTPGQYAAREAMQALAQGLHVMLFSDNVSLEEEKALKEYALARGLLVMGPDCGTAMINGVPLAFANAVRRGNIGLVAASGTGAQEVMAQIHRYGGGISQAIGTGGRDLAKEIGGMMMIAGLRALQADPGTKVIVLVSKPPAAEVAEKVLAAVRESAKPTVVYFINGDPQAVTAAGAVAAMSLEETAAKAVEAATGRKAGYRTADWEAVAREEKRRLRPGQRYVRGLFTGGTLCDEAMFTVKQTAGTVYSNIGGGIAQPMTDVTVSARHTFIDFGDDIFTVGRPHPMIEPSLRAERIVREARDPETAVILLDVVLGYGAHPDPAGVTAAAVAEAKRIAAAEGRYVSVIAYVLGTDQDPQGLAGQRAKLAESGAVLPESNIMAAQLAATIITGTGGEK